jgi:hypothetical protein
MKLTHHPNKYFSLLAPPSPPAIVIATARIATKALGIQKLSGKLLLLISITG